MDSIAFPNLGIEFEHVGKNFTVFGFSIAYYGVLIGLGILLCIWISQREAVRVGKSADLVYDLAIRGVIFGIIGARLYYVIFRWSDYKDNLLSILNLRQGGLAIYGGVIGAVLTIFFFTKRKKESFLKICDIVMVSFVLGQAIGRWGNFFNREAFGEYTNNLFAMRLPVPAVNAANITPLMTAHQQIIDGIVYIQVHPTFLYESVWDLLLFIFITLFKKHRTFDGEILLIYLGGYAFGRFWIEGLRTDQLFLFGTGIPVSQLLAALIFVYSVIMFIVLKKKSAKGKA